MSVLAIGITHEHEGFSAATISGTSDRKAISVVLQQQFGMEFDEFIVVKNDEVVDNWREGGE